MVDTVTELQLQHSKGQAQFAYFQLGIAASAIAFAIHETSGKALADTSWLIGLGVALWASSFALGCLGVEAHQRATRTNVRYLQATQGSRSYDIPPNVRVELDKAMDIAQKDANRPMIRYRLQMWTLFAGAVAYIGGHVLMMAATPGAPAPHARLTVPVAHSAANP